MHGRDGGNLAVSHTNRLSGSACTADDAGVDERSVSVERQDAWTEQAIEQRSQSASQALLALSIPQEVDADKQFREIDGCQIQRLGDLTIEPRLD